MTALSRTLSRLVPTLILTAAAGAAHADVIETYGAGSTDLGHWALTTSSAYLRQIEPTGGNPDGWLHGTEQSSVAAWGTSGSNPFTGDWAAEGVTTFEADLSIVSIGSGGTPVPPPVGIPSATPNASDRAVTLDVQWVGNVEAIYVGPDLTSPTPSGWQHYAFDVNAASSTIPDGWQVFRWDGQTATDADWQSLMQHVDQVSIGYWKPGYFYPSSTTWDLGLDNVGLITSAVPEPATAGMLMLGLAGLAVTRRRRQAAVKASTIASPTSAPDAGF